ncbi:MAG: hypothetical protein AB4911_20895 [Oscillochloridaceae bacterium umkhey_bin13]
MILQRNDLIIQLEDRLAGRISAERLAAWAFDLFYACEQGEHTVDAADAAVIAETLDALIFADDPSFALDEAALQQLLARLQAP